MAVVQSAMLNKHIIYNIFLILRLIVFLINYVKLVIIYIKNNHETFMTAVSNHSFVNSFIETINEARAQVVDRNRGIQALTWIATEPGYLLAIPAAAIEGLARGLIGLVALLLVSICHNDSIQRFYERYCSHVLTDVMENVRNAASRLIHFHGSGPRPPQPPPVAPTPPVTPIHHIPGPPQPPTPLVPGDHPNLPPAQVVHQAPVGGSGRHSPASSEASARAVGAPAQSPIISPGIQDLSDRDDDSDAGRNPNPLPRPPSPSPYLRVYRDSHVLGSINIQEGDALGFVGQYPVVSRTPGAFDEMNSRHVSSPTDTIAFKYITRDETGAQIIRRISLTRDRFTPQPCDIDFFAPRNANGLHPIRLAPLRYGPGGTVEFLPIPSCLRLEIVP